MRRHWLVAAVAICAALVLALPTAASARVKPLFAAMGGENVIAPDGRTGVGDLDGGGSFTAVIDGRWLCYGIALRDLNPLIAVTYTAHVHVGGRGTNGPEVIRLDPPSTVDPGSSSGCEWLEDDLEVTIPLNPRGYYVDVHSLRFPYGAARGQLFARES